MFAPHSPGSGAGLAPGRAVVSAARPKAATLPDDPGQRGPYEVRRVSITFPGIDGRPARADLHVPVGEGPFVGNVYAHGFGSNRRHARGAGAHLASWGVVTVAPAIGFNARPEHSARIVEAAIDYLHSAPDELGVELDLSRGVAVSGHSFGGLAASLAASHPGVSALVALDPNDNRSRAGRAHAGRVTVPSAFVFGGPQFLNKNGPALYDAIAGPKQKYSMPTARHLDFMSNSPDGKDAPGFELAMRTATAFILHHTAGSDRFDAYLGNGEAVRAAVARGEITAELD